MAKTQEKTLMFNRLSKSAEFTKQALFQIYGNQTADEKDSQSTLYINDTGLSVSVSHKFSVLAAELRNTGRDLTKFEHSLCAASLATNWRQITN